MIDTTPRQQLRPTSPSSTSKLARFTLSALAMFALAIGALVSLPSAASAAGGPTVSGTNNCAETHKARGCFIHHGDKIFVEDLDQDSWRPTVYWETDYGRQGKCTFTGASNPHVCNFNMAEGHTIEFHLALRSSITGKEIIVASSGATI